MRTDRRRMFAVMTLVVLATALPPWVDLKNLEHKLAHTRVERLGTHPGLVAQLSTARNKCSAGEFESTRNQAAGRSMCQRCPPGKYQTLARQTKCEVCPRGRYQPFGWRGARLACLTCPTGRVAGEDRKRCMLADQSMLRTGKNRRGPLPCHLPPATCY